MHTEGTLVAALGGTRSNDGWRAEVERRAAAVVLAGAGPRCRSPVPAPGVGPQGDDAGRFTDRAVTV